MKTKIIIMNKKRLIILISGILLPVAEKIGYKKSEHDA